jgi:hypothetical protein
LKTLLKIKRVVTARSPLIVLLNGPPYSGKDTAAKALVAWRGGPKVAIIRMSETIKRIAHDLYGLPPDTPVEAFSGCKDLPNAAFGGNTPRYVYIQVSEEMVKPVLGEDWFGHVAVIRAKAAQQRGARVVVFPDSGFDAEAEPLCRAFGRRNVMLIRIHASTRGMSFANDSRSHIELPDVHSVDLTNNIQGDVTEYSKNVVVAVKSYMRTLTVEKMTQSRSRTR